MKMGLFLIAALLACAVTLGQRLNRSLNSSINIIRRTLITESDVRNSFFKIIGTARIVGAGEATHGTHEFYVQKASLFKLLVLERGFNVLALEDSYSAIEAINRYIHSNERKITDDDLHGLYGFLQTKEMLELFDWIKAYNQEHENVLSCIGIDAQLPEPGLSRLKYLSKQKNLEMLNCINELSSKITILRKLNYNNTLLRDSIKSIIHTCFALLNNDFETEAIYKNLLQCLVEDEYRWEGRSARDYHMYLNVRDYLRRHSAAKIFIWSHNGHICYYEGTEKSFQIGGSLGYYLRHQYGKDYFSTGFLTAKGRYSATPGQDKVLFKRYALPKAKKGSLEYYFSKGYPNKFIINLTDKAILPCIPKRLIYRSASFYYQPKQFIYGIEPLSLYDAIYFSKTTHATFVID